MTYDGHAPIPLFLKSSIPLYSASGRTPSSARDFSSSTSLPGIQLMLIYLILVVVQLMLTYLILVIIQLVLIYPILVVVQLLLVHPILVNHVVIHRICCVILLTHANAVQLRTVTFSR